MEKWVSRTLAAAGVAAAMACGGSSATSPTPTQAASEDFSTTMNGSSEVPSVTTSATGKAAFVHEGDSVRFSIDITGLSGITDVKIFSGTPAQNGTARVSLFHADTPTGTINGNLVKGVFKAANVTGQSLDAELTEIRAANAYVNVLTTANTGGTIRGQLGTASNPDDPFFVLRRGN